MPYAADNRISHDPIDGGIEITEQQYATALAGMVAGLVVSTLGGFKVGPAPEPEPEPTPEPESLTAADYDAKLVALYQSTAQAMGYESWQTCALRAYKPGPFEAEGTAFYDWMEGCNVQAYVTLAAVNAGTRPQPTIDEFISELPAFVRPT